MDFFLDPSDPWLVQQLTYKDLSDLHDLAETGHDTDQWRFTVYSKHGVADVCLEGCQSSATQRICTSLSRVVDADPPVNIEDDTENPDELFFERFFYGVNDDTITGTENDYHNSGLGDDTVTGFATGFEVLEDHGGKDVIDTAGGNDLVISRSGGDIITLNGDGVDNINTVRVYPTHEKDHVFGFKDQADTL
jgi:hypothetical protein